MEAGVVGVDFGDGNKQRTRGSVQWRQKQGVAAAAWPAGGGGGCGLGRRRFPVGAKLGRRREEDDTLTGDLASVDISTEENLVNLVRTGEELLKKPISKVNLATGVCEPTSQHTNEEILKRIAEILSKERRLHTLHKITSRARTRSFQPAATAVVPAPNSLKGYLVHVTYVILLFLFGYILIKYVIVKTLIIVTGLPNPYRTERLTVAMDTMGPRPTT
uniref:Uncharacterized protein n=1 Tax=Chenopodium quinoa TaxID=63459 RepID=A0A803M2J3_CHEQI